MSGLFGGGSTTVVQAAAPTPLPPPTMPDPNSPSTIAAGQKQAAMDSQRNGSASTILTQPGSRAPTIAGGALGGTKQSNGGAAPATPTYSNTSL